MKNLTKAIYAQLTGSDISSDVGGRIYKGRAPAGAEDPFVVFFVVTDMPDHTFSEDYENVIVQFSLFSITSGTTQIEDMFTHLKTLYDEKTFSITGSTLVWMRRANTVFSIEDHTTPSGTQQVFVYHVDFEVLTSLN